MVNKSKTSVFCDTIYALSSGSPPSGVAVVRVSGPQVRNVLEKIAGGIPVPRQAELRTLRRGGEPLDNALVLHFPAPASFTGEDVAEFHLHGGRAVVQAVLEAIGEIADCRFAEAGDFTRRAFLNGKFDLTGAESLSDLISSETEAQRAFAMGGAAGAYRALYGEWQQRITRSRALIEAELDFPDEEDIPDSVAEKVWTELSGLVEEIEAHLEQAHSGEILRDGFSVVLIGAPNAGKSSLLNCLANREVAIVTEEAGTTRDLIEVSLDLGGYKVNVTDTAGIRERANRVEAIGVQKALERGESADLILLLTDLADPVAVSEVPRARDVVRVGTKSDLADACDIGSAFDMVISVKAGSGISELIACIGDKAAKSVPKGSLVPARARHVSLLRRCVAELNSAVWKSGEAVEVRAELLRTAADALGRITGSVDVEDLLDVIFSEFCIGK